MKSVVPSRRVPKYRKHKSTGQAVVTLNGRDFYLGRHGTVASREKYARLIAEWIERGRQVPSATPFVSDQAAAGLKVNEVMLGYLRHCQEYYRESPLEIERVKMALRPLRKLYGPSTATAFGPLALKAVRSEMCKQLARRTINQRIGVIKRMFKWAVSNELVPSSVFEGLRTVEGLKRGRSAARETEPVRPVPDEIVARTLPLLNPHVRCMVQFQRLTGTRSSEVCSLRPIDIEKSGDVWIYRPINHKTAYRGHDRVIFIGPRAQEILAPFLNIDCEEYVFSPRRMTDQRFRDMRASRKTKVQPSQVSRKKPGRGRRPGLRYDNKSYYRAIRRACRRGMIPRWHPHQLRHAAATELRKLHGIEVARIILGQRHLSTTELYAQLDGEKAREVMGVCG